MKSIIFPDESVSAIAAGRKTQTMQVIVPQPVQHGALGWWWHGLLVDAPWPALAPFRVGETAYVKEVWGVNRNFEHYDLDQIGRGHIGYRADTDFILDGCPQSLIDRWHSPMFLRERHARLHVTFTAVDAIRVQDMTEMDALREGVDIDLCRTIFRNAAGRTPEPSDEHCFEKPNGDIVYIGRHEADQVCDDCAAKIAKKHPGWYHSCASGNESDGPAACHLCGHALAVSLTKTGIDYELRLDPPNQDCREDWPVSGHEARILEALALGSGDLRGEQHGRLFQIGYATQWDSLNARRDYPWASNPWAWRYRFEVTRP